MPKQKSAHCLDLENVWKYGCSLIDKYSTGFMKSDKLNLGGEKCLRSYIFLKCAYPIERNLEDQLDVKYYFESI